MTSDTDRAERHGEIPTGRVCRSGGLRQGEPAIASLACPSALSFPFSPCSNLLHEPRSLHSRFLCDGLYDTHDLSVVNLAIPPGRVFEANSSART